jgi:hypothetical protein
MTSLISPTALLLPTLLSAVLVFLVSSIIHMVTPWHAGDFEKLPNEDGVLAALRPFALKPGSYVAPRPSSMKDMGSPEFQAKVKQGPSVMMTVTSGGSGMGKQLTLWFLYAFIVALFAGSVTSKALQVGADYKVVFKFVAAIAFGAYAMGGWQMSIWYQRPWSVTLKSTIDGLLYGCLTAGAFGWLWPR